ncbi:MAG: extensin family protein [Myxococcales bacterium]|nr:extensin family protein [Myxococcales bacterium]
MPRPGPFVLALAGLCASCAIPIIGAHGAERAHERRSRGSALTLHAERPDVPATAERCYAELEGAGVRFQRVAAGRAHGVQMPLQLAGPVGGVAVWPRGRKAIHGILDCRLALRLVSWAPSLRRARVTGLEHYSIYRPGARTPRRGRVSGHARGLAIDAARFHLESGEVVDVLSDWEDRGRGDAPCPQRSDEAAPSRLLRGVVCEAVEQRLFSVVLTPHHDRAHHNHVHLELKPEVSWTYVR